MEPQPIFFQDQRITLANSDGVVIRCRVVAKNRNKDVALAKDREIKAGELMVKAIKSAGLDNTDTQVEEVSLIGSTLNYGEDALMLKEETTKAVSARPAALAQLPVAEEKEHQVSKVVIPEPLFKTEGQTLPERDKIHKLTKKMNTVKKGGVLAGLVGLFKTKSSTQSITELGSIVAEMKQKNGKLHCEGNTIEFSPSEVGPYGRKSGTSADKIISYILHSLQLAIESEESSQIAVVKQIIEDLKAADWSKNYLIKNPNANSKLRDLLIKIHQLEISSPQGSINSLFGEHDRLLLRANDPRFHISPYDVFLSMINERSRLDPANIIPFDKTTIEYLLDWVAQKSNLQLLKQNPELHHLINTIYQLIRENCTPDQTKNMEDSLQSIQFNVVPELKQVESTLITNWSEFSTGIKTGKFHKDTISYRQFVQNVASDLSMVSAFLVKTADPSLIENDFINSTQEKITNLVAREILSPVVGSDPKQQAANMMQFFLDVQQELSKNQQLDPFFRIKAGLEKAAVKRLGILNTLSNEYQNRYRLMEDYADTSLEVMQDADNLLANTSTSFIPYIAYLQERLNLINEDHAASREAYFNERANQPMDENPNLLGGTPEQIQQIKMLRQEIRNAALRDQVDKLYNLKIMGERGKILALLAHCKHNLQYNPNLSTSINEELIKEILTEEQLFLLSYQFVPN